MGTTDGLSDVYTRVMQAARPLSTIPEMQQEKSIVANRNADDTEIEVAVTRIALMCDQYVFEVAESRKGTPGYAEEVLATLSGMYPLLARLTNYLDDVGGLR